uniref:Uncharacterized protein n=1 Tax=Daphnia galeata TaxID=27404 RepID=A0A8J2RSD1_9CRUS|nr:unnamed protein product [Daphnia galeata]
MTRTSSITTRPLTSITTTLTFPLFNDNTHNNNGTHLQLSPQ